MDLKTGTTLWQALTPHRAAAAPLDQDLDCDVAVVGAGVSGAIIAYLLSEAGVETIVLDRRGVARGSTPASTALVQYEVDTPLVDLSKMMDPELARAAYRSTVRALSSLAELIHRAGVDCSLVRTGSLYVAADPAAIDWVRVEHAMRREIGIDAAFLERDALRSRYGIDRPAAIHSTAALALDPLKLTIGLLDAASRRGVRVFSPVDAAPVQFGPDSIELATADGPIVRCAHLVLATGYETPECFRSIRSLCQMKSTYALASRPLEGKLPWPNAQLIWDTGEPYFYARQTPDRRIIIGGEDENFDDPDARDLLLPSKTARLVEKYREMFPATPIVPEFAWAGTFAETADGLPLIGPHPKWPGCHFALGYGGNGITFSMLAGEIIRDSILGRTHPDGKWFAFDRRGAM